MPASAARRRATSIIGSAPSLEMSVPRADQLGGHEARVTGTGGQLQHPLPGLEGKRLDHRQAETGMPQARTRSARLPQPAAARLPRLAGDGAQLVGVGGSHIRSLSSGVPRRPNRRVSCPNAASIWALIRCRRSPPAPRWPAGAAARSSASISAHRSGGMSGGLERLPHLPHEQRHERRRHGVAVPLDLLEHGEGLVERDAPCHHLLGHRQQRRARDLEAPLPGRHQHAQALGAGEDLGASSALTRKRRPSSATVSVCGGSARRLVERLAKAGQALRGRLVSSSSRLIRRG